MKRAAAYIRTSTDQQKYSLENQLAVIESFCVDAKLELVQIFSDIGKSGVTLSGRSGMRSLLETIDAGAPEFEAVIVYDVSRWGRFQDVDEGAFYEHQLRLCGVPVLYCAEVFHDDGSPSATIMKAMRRAMAAEYSRDLSRRIRSGARRAAERGFHLSGRPPYGYRRAIVDGEGNLLCIAVEGQRKLLSNHHTKLVLGPDAEVAAVRRVFRLFDRHHMTITAIAKLMASENQPKPWRRGWTYNLVRKMLRNEKYVGTSIYGRTAAPLRTRRQRVPPEYWVEVADTHEPIVSEAQFHRVQKRLKERRRFTKPEIVKGLRNLYLREGALSHRAISAADSLPSVPTIHELFGSLRAAYDAAGVPRPSGCRRPS